MAVAIEWGWGWGAGFFFKFFYAVGAGGSGLEQGGGGGRGCALSASHSARRRRCYCAPALTSNPPTHLCAPRAGPRLGKQGAGAPELGISERSTGPSGRPPPLLSQVTCCKAHIDPVERNDIGARSPRTGREGALGGCGWNAGAFDAH